ncbi:unnamed protein product, partial [Rotaria magnacalcarata]
KCNTMTIELSKYKERDASQMNELSDLHQSNVFLEREKLNLQVEIDSLRSKLIEEEIRHQKLQDQFLVEKLKRAGTHNLTDDDLKHDGQEIVRGIYYFDSMIGKFQSDPFHIIEDLKLLIRSLN